MLPQNPSGQKLLLLIRRSMREGEVEAVFHALSQSSFPQAEEICLRYKNDLDRFQKGAIDAETWCLDQISSFIEILNWPDFKQNQEFSKVELDKKLLLRMVNSLDLKNALALCETMGDSSIPLQAKYHLFEKMFNQAHIEIEIWELIRHSTQHQLWELGQAKAATGNFWQRWYKALMNWLLRLHK